MGVTVIKDSMDVIKEAECRHGVTVIKEAEGRR